jgi:hypothetical protein
MPWANLALALPACETAGRLVCVLMQRRSRRGWMRQSRRCRRQLLRLASPTGQWNMSTASAGSGQSARSKSSNASLQASLGQQPAGRTEPLVCMNLGDPRRTCRHFPQSVDPSTRCRSYTRRRRHRSSALAHSDACARGCGCSCGYPSWSGQSSGSVSDRPLLRGTVASRSCVAVGVRTSWASERLSVAWSGHSCPSRLVWWGRC